MADSGTRRLKRSRAWHRARWREHVVAQGTSGLSVVAYCAEHGLRRESFYRWRRAFLAEEEAPAPSSGCASDDSTVGGAKPAMAFAEVKLSALSGWSAASGVEVVLTEERRLRLGPGFDEETLRRAVSVLESLSC